MFAFQNKSVSRSSKPSNRPTDKRACIEKLEDRQMYSTTPANVAMAEMSVSHQSHVTTTESHAVLARSESKAQLIAHVGSAVQTASSLGNHAMPSSGGHLGAAEPYVTVTGLTLSNFSSYPLFSSGGPSINDVNQNQVGDCYFLSALGEEALKDPRRIRQLVSSNGNGTFNTWFYHNGWTEERVDGYLPVNSQGQLYYAGLGQGNSTWVAIMEKGFTYFRAAERGQAASYGAIDTGSCAEAFGDLGMSVAGDFGASAFGNGGNLANYVFQELQNGYAIELMTNSTAGPLVESHAYAVIAVAKDSAGTLYIETRNPWGRLSPGGQPYQWVNANSLMGDLADVVLAVP